MAIQHTSLLPQVAPYPSTFIWQCEQPFQKDWQTWSQALNGPLGGWLQPPHQHTVHLPYDPDSDVLYQPGHHGVWRVFQQPPKLWSLTASPIIFMQEPPLPFLHLHTTLPLPPPDQVKLFIGKVLAQNHYQSYQLTPWQPISVNSGRSMLGLYIPLSSPIKEKQ